MGEVPLQYRGTTEGRPRHFGRVLEGGGGAYERGTLLGDLYTFFGIHFQRETSLRTNMAAMYAPPPTGVT